MFMKSAHEKCSDPTCWAEGGAKGEAGGGRAAAAAALEAQVVRLMAAPSATWRLTGAHLLSQWLGAIPPGAPQPPLQAPGARLGELLAAVNPAYPSAPSPAPYSEVGRCRLTLSNPS